MAFRHYRSGRPFRKNILLSTSVPFPESKSLSNDEVYAVSAYILNLNGIVAANDVLDAQSLPQVKIPNRDGFIPFPRSPK
jgi:hypothetical protein